MSCGLIIDIIVVIILSNDFLFYLYMIRKKKKKQVMKHMKSDSNIWTMSECHWYSIFRQKVPQYLALTV